MDSLVSTDSLAEDLSSPDLRIVECTVAFSNQDGEIVAESGRSMWESGHIPHSAFVDLLTDIADRTSHLRYMMPPGEQFVAAMESLGIGEGTRVVLYDRDRNMWATRVWWMLKDYGFDDAAVLDGGWAKWTLEGRDVSTDPAPEHKATRFVDRRTAALIVGKEVVLEALDTNGSTIVNALSAAQHNGETDDYDRRGHIPGALNVPAADLVDPLTHVYLAPQELKARTAHIHDAGADRVIVYCGGGISATSTAFVLAHQGHDNVVIYDGSMSEWAADPSLPLEY